MEVTAREIGDERPPLRCQVRFGSEMVKGGGSGGGAKSESRCVGTRRVLAVTFWVVVALAAWRIRGRGPCTLTHRMGVKVHSGDASRRYFGFLASPRLYNSKVS